MDNQNLGNSQPSPTPEPINTGPVSPMGSVAEPGVPPVPQQVNNPVATGTTVQPELSSMQPQFQPQSSAAPSPSGQPKKKHLGLIIGIAVAAVVLLGGVGIFTAMAITSSQPDNILGSAINNLFNAKQITLDGDIKFSVNEPVYDETEYTDCSYDEEIYDCASIYNSSTIDNPLSISYIQLNLSGKSATNGSTSSINSAVAFQDGSTLDLIRVEDVFMKDGVIYLQLANVEDAYDQLLAKVSSESSLIPAEFSTIIKDIIAIFDNTWIRVSVDEILDSELYASIDEDSKDQIKQAYNCTISTISDGKAGSELAELYHKNPFIKMSESSNSFYSLSIKSNSLAKFINTLPNAKFINSLTSCVGYEEYNASEIIENLDAEEIASDLAENAPSIYAKFDGFMDYHLTELKMSQDYGDYSFSSNLKFTYPDSLSVSVPSDATSVTDIIQQFAVKVTELSMLYYSTVSNLSSEETTPEVEESVVESEGGIDSAVEVVGEQ